MKGEKFDVNKGSVRVPKELVNNLLQQGFILGTPNA
jgi:hypothetical protein